MVPVLRPVYPVNGRGAGVAQRAVRGGVGPAALLGARVGLGPLALRGHQPGEALAVDRDALLGRHLQGEVDREAVGVVQLERLLPLQRGGAALARGGPHLPHRGVEHDGAGRQGAPERLLLRVGGGRDPAEVGLQLGVGLRHPLQAHRQQLGQRGGVDAEQLHRPHAAAQQAAQDVAASLVARRDAVADQHQAGAQVVGDHAHPHVVVVVGAVAAAGQLGRLLDDRVDLVDLVEVVDALQQVRDPLQAHAGVDVPARQRADDLELLLAADVGDLLLHEDEVPDLEEAVLVDDRAAVGPVLGTAV